MMVARDAIITAASEIERLAPSTGGVEIAVSPGNGSSASVNIRLDGPESLKLATALRLAVTFMASEFSLRSMAEGAPAELIPGAKPGRLIVDPAWLTGAEIDADSLYRAAGRLLLAEIGTALRSAGAYLLWAAAALGHERAADRLIEERGRWRQRGGDNV